MFGLAGQVEQHRESGGTFDQCADCGAAKSDDEVALPVSRNRSVLDLGGRLLIRISGPTNGIVKLTKGCVATLAGGGW